MSVDMKCSKCKTGDLDGDMPEKGLCTKCLTDQSKFEYDQFLKGAKFIDPNADAGSQPPDGAMLLPFTMNPPKGEPKIALPAAIGIEVAAIYSDGSCKCIRLTPEEQREIYKRILDNRVSGKKELQVQQVMILPFGTFLQIHAIVEAAAAGNPDAQKLAAEFVGGMSDEGKPTENNPA